MECAASRRYPVLVLLFSCWAAGCGEPPPPDAPGEGQSSPAAVDPGSGPWVLVPPEQVAAVCQLDPALLTAAEGILNRPFAVVPSPCKTDPMRKILKYAAIALAVLIVVGGIILYVLSRPDVARFSTAELSGRVPVMASQNAQTIPTMNVPEATSWPAPVDGRVRS